MNFFWKIFKGLGFDSRSREKASTTKPRIFNVLPTFTVISVVRNPLETIGPVIEAVASSNYLPIGLANKFTPLEYKHTCIVAYLTASFIMTQARPLK